MYFNDILKEIKKMNTERLYVVRNYAEAHIAIKDAKIKIEATEAQMDRFGHEDDILSEGVTITGDMKEILKSIKYDIKIDPNNFSSEDD